MSVRLSTLSNGMRVVTDAVDNVETVSMGVYVVVIDSSGAETTAKIAVLH